MKMLIAMFSTDSYKDKNIIRDCGVKIIIIGGNTTIDMILFHFEQVQNDPVMWSERSRLGVTDVHHTQIKWTLLFIVQKDFSFCLILKNEIHDKKITTFSQYNPSDSQRIHGVLISADMVATASTTVGKIRGRYALEILT